MLFSWKNPLKALPVLLLLAVYAGAALGAAGNVQFVIGDAKLVTRAGVTRALQKGDEINEGDRVITAANASAQIKMVDGGFIAVRPNTDMGFDTYRYQGKEDGSESAIVSLLRGGFRTITGVIGRSNKQNYLIKTATATIGIRGTDHEPMVILPPAPGRVAVAEPGTYDKVNVGIAFIRTDAGSIDIQRNQVGFAPVTKAAPVILPRIPPFYKPTPAPGPQKAKEEKKEEGKTETAAAAPAEKAAEAPAETTAEAPAEIRETAVVDPTTAVAAGSTETTTAAAPAVVEPVVEITATDASGTTLNTTTQTTTTSTGTTTPIAETTTEPVQPPAPTVINPVVAASNYDFAVLGLKPVAGGVERIETPTQSPASANTDFVLDSNMNLVEILKSPYKRYGMNYDAQTPIASADVKFSGGAAADTASDPNGTYYLGRWAGGQIDVTDLATTSPVAPFTDLLGPGSAHWIIGLAPGSVTGPTVNAVQKIVGSSSYSTITAATHPTDSLGNVGTLNSAFLGADFSAQTVSADLNLSFSTADAANPSTRDLSLSAFATNVPIKGAGFDASGRYEPSVSCSGADCAANGYRGEIGGSFLSTASAGTTTGAVGTGVGIGYGFAADVPSPAANQPFPDFIQGVAVLSTGAAPPTGVNNFSSTAVLRDEVLWPTTQIATGANPAVTTYIVSDKLTGLTASSNFLFDASGNLVRVFDTPHVVYDHGSEVPGSTTQFAVPTPLAHAQLSFGGNGAASENYYDPATGARFGRWTGGVVNVLDLATGESYIESLLAPNGASRSLQWFVAQTPSSLPTSGVFHYTRIGDSSGAPSFATAPSDSYGNLGTLEGARLSADFTNMTASAGVRIRISSGPAGSLGEQNLSARFDNAPISGGGFNVSSGSDNPTGTDNLHIGCFGAGCAPSQSYGGRIRGGFDSATGNAGAADGALFRYTFNTRYGPLALTPPTGRVVDDYINGLVAFKQGPEIKLPTSAAYPVAAPTEPVSVVATYGYSDGLGPRTSGNAYYVDRPASGGLLTDAAGNLLALTEDPESIWGDNQALALSGGTATPATPIALAIGSTSTATDGSILLGWQAASPSLTVSGIDYEGCFGAGCVANPTPRTVLGDGLSWVRGPAPFPAYLPGAIAGYSNSALVIPGSATYNLGTSILHDQSGNPGTVNSAGLTVNFGRANVAFNMDATTSAGNWLVSASGIRLDQGGAFNAHAGVSGTTTIFSGTSVAPTSTHENMSVALNGSSTNTWGNLEGQLMGIGVGGAGVTYNLNSGSPSATASGALAFGLSGSPYSTLTPYHMALYTVGMTGAGEIDSKENTRIDGGFLSPYRTQMVDNFPVKIDGALPVVVSYGTPCTGICTFTNDMQVVYTAAGATPVAGVVDSIGTATLLQSGYDLATGIRWGRYGGGTIGVNDRISGQNLGTLDITNQNVHLLISTNQSGPTVLPITGTFNYAFVGGTSPTDSNGNIGAALTAANASLSANFATQKVDATLSNLSVGGNTWGASATGIPIQNNVFQAEKKLGGGGNLSVTSSLGADTAGRLIGGFTGQTGNGVGMAYSLNHGGNKNASNPAAVTVSGVAVFKR